ncbi:folate-binding protein YgfZ [Edaphobacter sp. HDX4]|uniref:CAF17-like 4Fe-4S cluster assembly/insertion protein YgfZ n=1 Tax=Edaphobacter sp. HDX4 TaxID=2794064 RepID=UPI002FE5E1D3
MTTETRSNTFPAIPSSSDPQLEALLHGVGIVSLDQTGWIRVTGSDRVRWLNGMATNSVQGLAAGEGVYNFFLNAQGRIQGDGNVFAREDELLIETSHNQVATLIPYLDHYIIMDDVELADISETRHGIALIGPETSSILEMAGLPASELKELQEQTVSWNSRKVTLIRAYGRIVPGFELWMETAEDAESLRKALGATGAVPCGTAALDGLRLLEGMPLFGTDIRDRDLPQETNQARALHFNKGCYLGQEIVERIRSRGSVHRVFATFRLEGTLPAPGTALHSAEKAVGELTSVAALPIPGDYGPTLNLALGYVRREALDRHEPLQYPGGVAHPSTTHTFTHGDGTSASSI